MKIVGTIQKIDKYNNLVVDTPSSAAEHLTDRYTYYLVLNGVEYYFVDAKLRENTRAGNHFTLISNAKNEILAWRNHSTNTRSNYTLLHLLFHSNTIVALGVFGLFWFMAKDNLNLRSKINLFGIPVLILVFLYSIYLGYRKLEAHRELNNS